MKATPMDVYAELKAKGGRPQKLKNLEALFMLCQDQYDAGSRDFSTGTMAQLCEARHIMNAKGLFNASAADYRTLFKAFQDYVGPAPSKPRRVPEGDEFLMRIPDPAIRMLAQQAVIKARKLEAQLNTLRKSTTFLVDRRPELEDDSFSTAKPAVALTHAEREALERAISSDFLDDQGWTETSYGEVVNERGRTIFEAGFTTAVRKVIGRPKQ